MKSKRREAVIVGKQPTSTQQLLMGLRSKLDSSMIALKERAEGATDSGVRPVVKSLAAKPSQNPVPF